MAQSVPAKPFQNYCLTVPLFSKGFPAVKDLARKAVAFRHPGGIW
jgi:hypothetical protein